MMPMVYWQDWSGGNVIGYIDPALRNGRQLGTPAELIPVFSVTEGTSWGQLSEAQIRQYMALCGRLCQSNGVRRISYFYYGNWETRHFERVRASYFGPVSAVTPGRNDFGSVGVGQTSQRNFTVANVGTDTLTVTVSCDAPFSIVAPGTTVIVGPGQSTPVTIGFAPTQLGAVQGTVRFQSPEGSMERLALGTGADATPPSVSAIRQGNKMVFSWPTNSTGFGLEYATGLPATSWFPALPAPVVVGGENVVTNTMTGGARFYRLRK